MNLKIIQVLKRLYLSFSVLVLIGISALLGDDFIREIKTRTMFEKAHSQLEKDTSLKLNHSHNLSLFENRELIYLRAKNNFLSNNSNLTEDEKLELITLEIELGKKPNPIMGHIEDGYKFTGGDPSKQENWVKTDEKKPPFDPNLYLIHNKCFDSEGQARSFSLDGKIPEKLSREELDSMVLQKLAWKDQCLSIKDFSPGKPLRKFFEMLGILLAVSVLFFVIMKWVSWLLKPVSPTT